MSCGWSQLLAILPPKIRQEVDRQGRELLQEIRLRVGQPIVLTEMGKNRCLSQHATKEDLQFVFNGASRYSPWTATSAASGYLTAPGGHRIGLCGDAIMRDGVMTGINTLRSLNIRIARDFPGISRNLGLRGDSILVIGPPGSGKTTLLRDIIRTRSEREAVAVVDERGELFPSACSFVTGPNTDILTGCGKPQGIEALLRTMSPRCIAVDEITATADCQALLHAGWCGVRLLATAHASDVSDLLARSIYAPLVKSGLFDTVVILQQDKSWRMERMVGGC